MNGKRIVIDRRGYAMLSVVVLVAVLLTSGVALLQLTRSELHGTANHAAKQKAFFIAERGVQHGLTKLEQDRLGSPGSVSTLYSASLTNQAFDSGTYNVTIAQDGAPYASDPTRKLITSTAQFANQQATVTAHAIVQKAPASTICFTGSGTGTCRIISTVSAASSLFSGEIFSNNNVSFDTTVGVALRATGNVYARNTFTANGINVGGIVSLPAILAYMPNASLYYGGATPYVPGGSLLGISLDLHTLIGAPLGIHFNNGANAGVLGRGADGQINHPNGHGVQQAISARDFPHPDYEALKRNATTIVRAGHVPFGSWDNTSNTWIAGTTSATPGATYFVEGDVYLTGLNLIGGSTVTIVARGAIAVESITVLSVGLLANSVQNLRLIAEDGVYVGRRVLSLPIVSNLDSELTSLTPGVGATGIGLNVAGILNTTNMYAYSETSDVWLEAQTLAALSHNNVNMMAWQNATLAYTASVASAMASTTGLYAN